MALGLWLPGGAGFLAALTLFPAWLASGVAAYLFADRWRLRGIERVPSAEYARLERRLGQVYWSSFVCVLWLTASCLDSSWRTFGYESSDGRWAARESEAKGRDFAAVQGMFEEWRDEHASESVVLVRTTRLAWWSPFDVCSSFTHPRWKVPYRPSSESGDAPD